MFIPRIYSQAFNAAIYVRKNQSIRFFFLSSIPSLILHIIVSTVDLSMLVFFLLFSRLLCMHPYVVVLLFFLIFLFVIKEIFVSKAVLRKSGNWCSVSSFHLKGDLWFILFKMLASIWFWIVARNIKENLLPLEIFSQCPLFSIIQTRLNSKIVFATILVCMHLSHLHTEF